MARRRLGLCDLGRDARRRAQRRTGAARCRHRVSMGRLDCHAAMGDRGVGIFSGARSRPRLVIRRGHGPLRFLERSRAERARGSAARLRHPRLCPSLRPTINQGRWTQAARADARDHHRSYACRRSSDTLPLEDVHLLQILMRAFLRPFWLSAALSLALCLLAAHAALIIGRQNDVAKPPLPIPGRTYVSSYPRGFADHYLFLFGLFGFGERIHNADVLISGSSHPQLGLSADQLSHGLSEKSGSHVRAFNMSLAFGEGMAFTRDILQRNDIEEKTMI